MSLSPSDVSNTSESPLKRRRNTDGNGVPAMDAASPTASFASGQSPQVHIPKRGARACTACRKGKNRCEGEAPCRRCQLSGAQCIFEKPEKKKDAALVNGSIERVSRLEGQFLVMQSQMIGLQSSLDRILSAIQGQVAPAGRYGQNNPAAAARDMQGVYVTANGPPRGSVDIFNPSEAADQPQRHPAKSFPPLPGFAPPPHKYATYGIVPSTAPSSDDESEDTLPRSSLNAPIEALQGLANAAAEAAAAPSDSPPRVRKRKKAEPTPRNAFPHVVEKGLVTDAEARELYHVFFSGCHIFIPLFDPSYDTYEGLKERTPWTFDAILAIASKIRSGTSALTPTFYKCLEEAQGIARSSLFGPIVRKEAVQGMLLLAAWSTNGWLPSGHAMRMALDLGLHRALEKLADPHAKRRSEEEERDLVVSARIWLCLYWFDHQMSLGTSRPIVLRDESSIRHCRLLLTHPMASPTDVRLISMVELIAQKTQIYETLTPLNGQVNHSTLQFIRRANVALDKWWADNNELHARTLDEDSLPRKILAGELHYAKLWLVCLALRGVSWDKMPFEQRELAFDAKDAASTCLSIFLNSPSYRAALRYAVHDSLVTAAFSGLFLLKMANLFPSDLDLAGIITQVEQLAQLLSDVAAERYALTLRIMLANLRRKVGVLTAPPLPSIPLPAGAENMLVSPSYIDPGAVPAPMTMEELGFAWPSERGIFSPSAIPTWLQEGSLTDLGIPMNGSDGIFLQLAGPNGWAGDFAPMPEAW
ncbi:uncharacterized protein FOMMEDRAFT_20217 [Fomitiporia mediterranea MF3/22]|uniref:uncharacterized protein n=1 Tax=Fomitiporia mediterranea (strain MF3/22) TaxID=694068 RepID=UPI0004407724|nr:uncharacterized protein FOMMEDRAFT_20217 [Fomitiporia mediterranea MF3/22]EJD03045.1 hypothetical protein FOMMEDRAFT_20217 [Fomitiporia mediterranea MF3/22]